MERLVIKKWVADIADENIGVSPFGSDYRSIDDFMEISGFYDIIEKASEDESISEWAYLRLDAAVDVDLIMAYLNPKTRELVEVEDE